MESGDITRSSRALVTVIAVAALLIAVYTVVSELSGPEVYGPGDTEIEVSAGDRFTIEVPDDPADGQRWIVAAPRPDPAVLRATGEEAAPASAAGGQPSRAAARAHWTSRPSTRAAPTCGCCGADGARPGRRTSPGARLNFRITVG
ncbi:hypothetical protein O1L55_27565 [Streptomyces albulus]|nr:hypothetical protein [Streptomyces noursei]